MRNSKRARVWFVSILIMLSLFTLFIAVDVRWVKADAVIYIRADGSIDPQVAFVQRFGSNYVLADDIYGSIVIEKDGIILDGMNHTVQSISENEGIGLGLSYRRKVTVHNIKFVGFEFGVYLYYSNDNFLGEDIALMRNRMGVWLENSSHNIVTCNFFTSNFIGIDLFNSSYNLIEDNLMIEGGIGISLDYSSNGNVVEGNEMTRNGEGLGILWSGHNKIYHNNFIENPTQTYVPIGRFCISDPYDNLVCSPFSNSWDDGYSSGGNYWSNHNATDILSGPNQDHPGSDGIADTPFNIPHSDITSVGQDRYPLMSPWISSPPSFGDVNSDGKINIIDIASVACAFGSSIGGERYKPECDLSNDGYINIIDIAIIASKFGKTH